MAERTSCRRILSAAMRAARLRQESIKRRAASAASPEIPGRRRLAANRAGKFRTAGCFLEFGQYGCRTETEPAIEGHERSNHAKPGCGVGASYKQQEYRK